MWDKRDMMVLGYQDDNSNTTLADEIIYIYICRL